MQCVNCNRKLFFVTRKISGYQKVMNLAMFLQEQRQQIVEQESPWTMDRRDSKMFENITLE